MRTFGAAEIVAAVTAFIVFRAPVSESAPAGLLGVWLSVLHRMHSSFPPSKARAKAATIASMQWGELEKLIGQAFRRRGFTVTGFGGRGSEGGGDLALVKNGERFLVQCKHWRKQQVGVTMLRELSGVLRTIGARGGYVITAGEFSREAREFARSARLELIDGESLLMLIA